ncbi:MAG: transcriptional repressor, partial [Acidobacteria bacterium]|nr:transcriptional repressor [Acidobacteriota bacterium]
MSATPARRVSTGERINANQSVGRLESELESRGIRLTRQRRVIVQVVDGAQRHLDADEILERAKKLDPGVHRVTVYRTLDLLKRLGLIDELDLLHLRGIGLDERDTVLEVIVQAGLLADRDREQVRKFFDGHAQIDRRDEETAFAGVGEHLLRESGGALGDFFNLAHVAVRGRAGLAQRARREAGVAEDASEQIVEIVRNAAGE